MKFEIDTTEKTITLKDEVLLGTLIQALEVFNINTAEYKIKSDVISEPYSPFIPVYPTYPTYPTAPSYPFFTICQQP